MFGRFRVLMKVFCSWCYCVLVVVVIVRGLMWIFFWWIVVECGGGGGVESMVDWILKFFFIW